MACNINLQRNSEIYLSVIDIANGAQVTSITPANTWRIEILAGYALSQASAVQDITTNESGPTPDRSSTRFITSINPVDWNFQCYLRPTGAETTLATTGMQDGNSRPVADWAMWQTLISNTAFAIAGAGNSAWENGGRFRSIQRTAAANVAASRSNFSAPVTAHLYFKLDNVVYQVSNAAINEASVDAAIDGIATTTWTGFASDITELTGTVRNNAISVFGGVLNNGSRINGNSNAYALTAQASYHPWASYNVAGAITGGSFIRNKLSTVDVNYTNSGGTSFNYTFPVTNMTWSYNNNITFLTPEELAALNTPIGSFVGSRLISGSISAYLRAGSGTSGHLLSQILADRRTSHSPFANANLQVGGTTAPFVAFYMPAVQYELPVHQIEDVISLQINFQAQESNVNCGLGDEVTIFADRA